MTRKTTLPEDRFWSHVDKNGPMIPDLGTRCWDWTAALMHRGYGHFGVTSSDIRRSHRYSYELSHGPIPKGLVIDHLCFRPKCVNPSHLRVITPKKNNEHRKGANRNSKSGVRGVWRDSSRGAWVAECGSKTHGKRRGRFKTLREAEDAVVKWRAELFGSNRGTE